MENAKYKILDDGYAVLGSAEEVKQFYSDHDIIGKIVRHVEVYRRPDDIFFRFDDCHEPPMEYGGCKIKALLTGYSPIIFVIGFIDGTYLMIDDSDDDAIFFKYDDKVTTLPGMVLVDPDEYDCLFNNIDGAKFIGVDVPSGMQLTQVGGSLNVQEYFNEVYLMFSGYDFDRYDLHYYVDKDSAHKDVLSLGLTVSHCPDILYYTDLDIDYYTNYSMTADLSQDLEGMDAIACIADDEADE